MAEVPDVAAYGGTLESARIDLVRQLSRQLGIYRGEISVEDLVELPTATQKAVSAARAARNSALEAAAASQEATGVAARELTAQGLSLRDCGYLLGLSHGRVRQILDAEGAGAEAKRARRKTKPRNEKTTKTTRTGDRL